MLRNDRQDAYLFFPQSASQSALKFLCFTNSEEIGYDEPSLGGKPTKIDVRSCVFTSGFADTDLNPS
jgi:hypothetical protein